MLKALPNTAWLYFCSENGCPDKAKQWPRVRSTLSPNTPASYLDAHIRIKQFFNRTLGQQKHSSIAKSCNIKNYANIFAILMATVG